MNTTTLTDDGATVLFTNPPAPGFTIWYKPNTGRAAWEPIATCPTERACLDAMETSGKHNGKWNILPNGKEP